MGLHAYVASDLGLLDTVKPDSEIVAKRVRLTLEQLGKFIAITIMWPDLIMDLLNYLGIPSESSQSFNALSIIPVG